MDKKEYNLEQNLKELEELISLYGQQPDEASCKAMVEKVESIYKKYSTSEEIVLVYAGILFNLSFWQTELKELEATVEKLQVLHQQFPESPDIALEYAKILVNLSAKQTEIAELEVTVEKLKVLQESYPYSEDIASRYAMVLFNLSAKQTEIAELEVTVEKLKPLQERYPDSKDIAFCYAMILVYLSAKQTEIAELEVTVEKLKALQERYPDSEDIASRYAMVLVNLSVKQTEIVELEVTVEKLKTLQERYPDSEDIASRYAMVLVYLSVKQTEIVELEVTVEKLKTLQECYPDSKDIAFCYAMVLFNLSAKQTELKEREASVEKIKALHEHFPESEAIAFIYSAVLVSLYNHKREVDELLQTAETIKKLYKQFSTFMLQIFDDLFFRNDNICDSEEYKLFNFILKEGLLRNTKYAILQTWTERYKEDSDELKNLLSIYQYVQKIKYQLGLKDEDKKGNIKFGHYTKGSVLQILLDHDQREGSSFSISGKTRLNNANYMNDPEEGIIIEKILGLDRRDALEPSSWFLMSFTIKTDDLAMWSQYGDDAKGVCIVLREDDFSRFSSFNDVSWREEIRFSRFTSFNEVSWREEIRSLDFINKMDSTILELSSNIKNSQSKSGNEESIDTVNDEGTELNADEKYNISKRKADYLYRIAYINDVEGQFSIEKTELFKDDEIINLELLLKALKEKIDQDLNKGDDFYQKAISDCVEEIRYLFKSVDYKYEDELRILRYANLDSENTEIKIDKSSGMGKLYVERENPVRIGEVVFGPKFPNPEYVTPLLKLLDKDIVFKKSTIKFR